MRDWRAGLSGRGDGDWPGNGPGYHGGQLTEVRLDILQLVIGGQLVTSGAEDTVNREGQGLGGEGRGVGAQGQQRQTRHGQEWSEQEGVSQGQGAGRRRGQGGARVE